MAKTLATINYVLSSSENRGQKRFYHRSNLLWADVAKRAGYCGDCRSVIAAGDTYAQDVSGIAYCNHCTVVMSKEDSIAHSPVRDCDPATIYRLRIAAVLDLLDLLDNAIKLRLDAIFDSKINEKEQVKRKLETDEINTRVESAMNEINRLLEGSL